MLTFLSFAVLENALIFDALVPKFLTVYLLHEQGYLHWSTVGEACSS